jgi:transposase InsO family protein
MAGKPFKILSIVDEHTREAFNHAKGIIGIWKEDYNTTRPHSSLGYLAPAVYAQQCTH